MVSVAITPSTAYAISMASAYFARVAAPGVRVVVLAGQVSLFQKYFYFMSEE